MQKESDALLDTNTHQAPHVCKNQHLPSIHTLRKETTNYIANRNGSEATLIIQPASENVWHGAVRVQPTHSWSAESHFQRGGASAITNIAKFTSTTNAGSMTRVTNTTNVCMNQDCVSAARCFSRCCQRETQVVGLKDLKSFLRILFFQ